MSQYSVPPACTGSFGNRLTSCSSMPLSATRAPTTRPLEAPRSTPATVTGLMPAPAVPGVTASTEERRGDARVDRDQQAGGERQVAAGEGEDGGGDVLGEHL